MGVGKIIRNLVGIRYFAISLITVACIHTQALSHPLDFIEHLYGASYTNAAIGNSGLSANIAHDGTLTVLLWPTPSYFEHMDCTPANDDGTPPDHDNSARNLPYFGTKPNECSFAGLVIKTGSAFSVTWFRDKPWKAKQNYFNEDSNALVTTYKNDELGILVVDTTFVHAEKDILARRHEIAQEKSSPVTIEKFIYFAHLAPKGTFSKGGIVTEFLKDTSVQYSALYEAETDAVFYFPASGETQTMVSKLPHVPSGEDLSRLISNLKTGVNIFIGLDLPSSEHQIGFDAFEEKIKEPVDALSDVQADGVLSGSTFAPWKATCALAKTLSMKPGQKKEVTVYFSFGETASEGKSNLRFARSKPVHEHLNVTNGWWKKWISRANLPRTKNPLVRVFSKRALMSIRTGYDKKSGGIVASISTNPPYHFDWPRDGVFFDYALNIAGYNDMVNHHHRFFASVLRKKDGDHKPVFVEQGNAKTKYDYVDILGLSPKGSFAMNYYTNGMMGGPIANEIDQTGLTLWMWWENLKWVKDKKERDALAKEIYLSVVLAAENLTLCKDETNDLSCYANEDDSMELSQSMNGAMPVWMGLDGAVKFARYMRDEARASRWEKRKRELGEAIIKYLRVPEKSDEPEHFGSGRGATWLIWPAWFFDPGDPRMENQAEWIRRKLIPIMEKNFEGSSYDAVATSSLAMYYYRTQNKENSAFIEKAILFMLENIPTKGVFSIGEGYGLVDRNGDGVKEFENRVALPHIEEATLFYLTFMALYNPEDFIGGINAEYH